MFFTYNTYYTLYILKEFDKKSGDPWYKRVVLKYVENNLSINEEIQILLAMNTPISQQRRLERKISKYINYHSWFYSI